MAILVVSMMAGVPAGAGPTGDEGCCHVGGELVASGLSIRGGQYLVVNRSWWLMLPGPGFFAGDPPTLARYIGTPGGAPLDVGEAPAMYKWVRVRNSDPVMHTVTECVEGCDTARPVAGTSFDATVGPVGEALVLLPVGIRSFMCTIHPWMRGQVSVW